MRSTIVKTIAALLCASAAFTGVADSASDSGTLQRSGDPQTLKTACLASGDGFFRAQLNGALELKLDWENSRTLCEGMPRPDGKGIRLSFSREPGTDGPRLRIVIGVAGVSESTTGQALPANLTIIDEDRGRIFSTTGDNRCTIDTLRQRLAGDWRKEARRYQVSGRGFCTQPARTVNGEESVLVSTFDFNGQVIYD